MIPSRSENQLLIGEVAQLLGTTPKAIRHYEKVGLLNKLERSESGYRLYTANDLLRLHRIKKLQYLGLSLLQIKNVLEDGDSGIEFERVLKTLLGEVESQIEHFEGRQHNLRRMLAEEATFEEDISDPDEKPHVVGLLEEHLGELWNNLDPLILKQMTGFWNTLDGFHWPEGYKGFQKSLARYIGNHPAECKRLLALEERLAVLAHRPESSHEVEQLAEDYAVFFENSAFAAEIRGELEQAEKFMNGLETILAGVVVNAMSTTQKRCMELLGELLSSRKATL